MKFVIIKRRFFSDTDLMNEMFEKSNFHEENVQKIMIFKAKFPKNGKFQGIIFFVSLHHFLCKEFSLTRFSLFAKNLCLLTSIASTSCGSP